MTEITKAWYPLLVPVKQGCQIYFTSWATDSPPVKLHDKYVD